MIPIFPVSSDFKANQLCQLREVAIATRDHLGGHCKMRYSSGDSVLSLIVAEVLVSSLAQLVDLVDDSVAAMGLKFSGFGIAPAAS